MPCWHSQPMRSVKEYHLHPYEWMTCAPRTKCPCQISVSEASNAWVLCNSGMQVNFLSSVFSMFKFSCRAYRALVRSILRHTCIKFRCLFLIVNFVGRRDIFSDCLYKRRNPLQRLPRTLHRPNEKTKLPQQWCEWRSSVNDIGCHNPKYLRRKNVTSASQVCIAIICHCHR